jgi:succinate-semialdehyde dehydrogenase / glutarate-semialdehyde dehydrogenase
MKQRPIYLNGEWRNAEKSIPVTDPGTGEVFDQVASVGRAETEQAIRDAHTALPAWRERPASERAGYLTSIAEALLADADDIAETITRENGKPLAQSRGEVMMAADHFRWFAEEARRAYGRVVPHQARGKRHMVIKSPVGVVGAIAPWNFPLVLSVRKVAPALAAGCPTILKPASATPLSGLALAKCAHDSGIPAGVFQVVAGNAREIAGAMIQVPQCRKISFTGSTEVGKALIRSAADTVTKLSLELGGHAPLIVCADADLDQAVAGSIIAKFRNTGQSCIAANRIYVHRSVYQAFLDRFVAAASALKVGNGFDDGVDVGPLIDGSALADALRHIDDAVGLGAGLLCGGKRSGGTGNFLEPTVIADVPDGACCMSEETFAPVAPVAAFEDIDHVIGQANATDYGLAAYVFTNDLRLMYRFAEELESGTICINESAPATSQCPFGGIKQSGWGRELGTEGLDAYLETKHIAIGGMDR